QKIGKKRVIAETGAGQHGVATATAAALLGLECVVYMGEEDTRRQALNVARMRLLGAEVVPVTTGSRTLKDAINEAMRDWVTNVETTNYVFGTVAGRHPRRAARSPLVPAAGRERADDRVALDLGRPGLPGRRPRALVPARRRPGGVPADHRRPGDGGVLPARPLGGHHPGDRVGPRA